jgi:hypothetical protein
MDGNNLPAPAGQAAPTPSVNDAPPLNWRAHLPVHPAAEFFPLMKDKDPAAFKDAIVSNPPFGNRGKLAEQFIRVWPAAHPVLPIHGAVASG